MAQHFNFKVSDVKKAGFDLLEFVFAIEFHVGKELVANHFFDFLESKGCQPSKFGNSISLFKFADDNILTAGLIKKSSCQNPAVIPKIQKIERRAIEASSPQWVCKERSGGLRIGNWQQKNWSIENREAEVGKLRRFTYCLKTTFSYQGQYDGCGVYELTGERESRISTSYSFNIYLLNENKEICEQEFINSIKAKIPKIGIDKVKEKEVIRNFTLMTSLEYQIYNVDLEYFFAYFIEKGDIPLDEIVKYSKWRKDKEKEYRKNLL